MAAPDLNLLRSLDVLLEENHVTRAARRLGLSQPALSAQLARLRDVFGDPLLVASGKKLVPTQRALALKGELRVHLRALDGLVARGTTFDPATTTTTFHVAASDAIQTIVGARLARLVMREAPRARFAMVQPLRERLERDLETGSVSLVLGPRDSMHPSWRQRLLYHETFVTIMRMAHPLAGRPLSLDDYCAARHLLVSTSGGGFVGLVDEVLAARQCRRDVAVSVQDFLLVAAMLRDTDLIATVPARLAQGLSDEFSATPPPIELQGFDVVMAWHPVAHKQPDSAWLRDLAVKACALLR